MKILLVEDEASVSSFLIKGLEEQNIEVDLAKDGLDGKILSRQENYNLIILDVMLPRLTGLELCQDIRKHNKTVPILMLSALGTLDDKVGGLELGADDYLVKPFHFKELLARIQALTRLNRLQSESRQSILVSGSLELDPNTQLVKLSGKEMVLTAKEYSLLEFFMKNQNRILSRMEIAESVWGNHFDSGTNIVDVYVNYLRKKMEKGYPEKWIHTQIGRGYMFKNEPHS
jgi:DNA-binding response OmpR family regulator